MNKELIVLANPDQLTIDSDEPLTCAGRAIADASGIDVDGLHPVRSQPVVKARPNELLCSFSTLCCVNGSMIFWRVDGSTGCSSA